MRERCPDAEIVTDVGSGLNFKRKGLKAVLERALQGTLRSVTVAHRDRLCRFGFELIKWLLERQQVELVVLDDERLTPECEFTEDLLAIVHAGSTVSADTAKPRKKRSRGGDMKKRKEEDADARESASTFRVRKTCLRLSRAQKETCSTHAAPLGTSQ